MPPVVPPRLAHVLHAWRSVVSPHRRAAIAGSLLLAVVLAAHLARVGTLSWRAAAASVLSACALAWTLRAVWEWRAWRDPARAARTALSAVDKDLARQASRAVSLVGDPNTIQDPISHGLAHLHLERVIARIGHDRLESVAKARGAHWQRAALVLIAVALAVLVAAPLRFVEGADVMLARRGRAPIALEWVDSVVGQVQVPRYLRQQDQAFFGMQPTSHPRGSVITVHAQALHAGRHLVLTDGATEVAFADDGRGGIAARWTLADSVQLQIGARFGDVLVVQRDSLDIESIADEAPHIELEDAPRTVKLAEASEIPIRYRATDDHGLTQVDLVIRAGDKEERRVLARYQGQEVDEKGSVVVSAGDSLLRRAWVPVELSIEARDNDPITGPKWGKSEVVTVVPPAIGEAEAQRFEALASLRDRLVDQLAFRIANAPGESPDERRDHTSAERTMQQAAHDNVIELGNASFGGRQLPGRLRAFLLGQVERLGKAVQKESAGLKTKPKDAHAELREKSGGVVLAVDSAIRSFGAVDAMAIAKRLADVAQAAATGAELARQGELQRGKTKLAAATQALRAGSSSLSRLESLGKDLGEVVDIGVRRIDRAASAGDFEHAQLAAEHLAARLRRPFPSFSGGGGRGTGGDGVPGADQGDEASAAEDQFDQQQSEIERIARDHAAEMDELRDLLDKTMKAVDDQALREAVHEHAERVRRAVRALPTDTSSGSPVESASAVVRSNAEMMADSMDRMAMAAAASGARNALNAADNAQRLAEDERKVFGEPSPLAPRVAQARQTVEEELRWLDEQRSRMQRDAADKSRGALDDAAKKEEDFGKRAEDLGNRSRDGDAPLPQSSSELLDKAAKAMRDAASSFRARDPDRGSEQQREAQRMLEMAQAARDSGEGSESDARDERSSAGDEDSANGRTGKERVDIPGADQFKGPEGFRRRVLDGLGATSDPRLRDAVRRYAEGLLR